MICILQEHKIPQTLRKLKILTPTCNGVIFSFNIFFQIVLYRVENEGLVLPISGTKIPRHRRNRGSDPHSPKISAPATLKHFLLQKG